MQKIISAIAVVFIAINLHAQIREIPQTVKDAFTQQYPGAADVEYKDQLTKVDVHFKWNDEKMIATYTNKGIWKGSEKEWSYEKLSDSVKDGFEKSKYADWEKEEVALLYIPGGTEQYRIRVKKNDLQKKYLFFNAKGRLLREAITL